MPVNATRQWRTRTDAGGTRERRARHRTRKGWHAFQLTDSEASAARADATSDIFKRTIFEAVADGQWSPADQAKADATATALGLPDKQARAVFQTAAMAAMRASLAAAVADRRLHGSEEAQLNTLAERLGITFTIAENATARSPDVQPRDGPNVSYRQEGAMGVRFANFTLFDDKLDVKHPEVLVYEPRMVDSISSWPSM
jgi:hypothetical protein